MMKSTAIKAIFAALVLAGSCAAQAAHFEVIGYQMFGGYSGSLNDAPFSHEASDLSQDGDVALFGTTASEGAGYSHGYAADGYFQGGSQLWMSASQYLSADAGTTYAGDTLVSLPQIALRIVGDGEAAGTAVQVSFTGLASATGDFGPAAGSLMMDMAVTRGDTTLGGFLSDAVSGDQAIGFSFAAQVGDEVLLSAFMGSNLMADGSQGVDMASVSGAMTGSFAVAAVPEPGQYALFLAGLGLLGLARRRHK